MNIEYLEGIIVYILESLHGGDIRTGKNLCDDIRQYQYDFREIHIEYKYYDIENKLALQETLLLKTDDIHPPKSVISVHFFCLTCLMALQI